MRPRTVNKNYETNEIDELFNEQEFYEDLLMEQKEQM